ncbi:hypothetical protein AGDE_16950 [Angomonas deanei]|uniref:Uncharacterized protein n=1 Tax=Angomonas deanei TaxID=59799 RepID=A0A7G2C214_9TRYP|nr:hypothetical protein AGDE_16950 [Angomonas deanei]CAD2213585.1 hypothetical protein, conserved [Angomonas deanei]|eukprot:EPY15837.1 hypothetical protein AGDE_16950 [Angomonas deanei]
MSYSLPFVRRVLVLFRFPFPLSRLERRGASCTGARRRGALGSSSFFSFVLVRDFILFMSDCLAVLDIFIRLVWLLQECHRRGGKKNIKTLK